MPATADNMMAAIDIGASAIRMDVAEVGPDGKIHVLESLKRGVQLGKDTFTEGYLSEESIKAACRVLQDFKKVLDTYGIIRSGAVATSAVREASNRDTFLDRVLMSTGFEVSVIDGSEENRLTYTAVLESLREGPDIGQGQSLMVEVGGGSADVTLLEGGGIVRSGTFPLGSIRLRASVASSAGNHLQQTRMLKAQIANILAHVKRSIVLDRASNFITIGGDVRFVARIAPGVVSRGTAHVLSRELFSDFVDSVAGLTIDELIRKYNLSYLDAETLTPALLTYRELLMETQARDVIISSASIRAGLLQDLMPTPGKDRLADLRNQILSAARSLGRKYGYDEGHAERVRTMSELIFDFLRDGQRMNDTHRLYLQVAALLHDIGIFISSRSHHKHSYYIIAHSELFGLRRRELEIIANVARYHRRALPQRAHLPFISLERDERMIVSKLAAILRVANALDKEHLPKIADFRVAGEGDQVLLIARNPSDLAMERAALANRGDLFGDVFGKRIVLREEVRKS